MAKAKPNTKTTKPKTDSKVEITYQRVGDQFFSMEMPSNWEARYLQVKGVDQHNMITFRSPKDVGKTSTSPNAASIQYFDRDELLKFEPQEYANTEAAINPGGKTKAKFSVFNALHGITAITEDLPFKLDKGKVLCDVWTFYIQNPKNLKLFRVSYWCEKKKVDKLQPIFDHMLKSFQLK
ncbi:Uncharacterised protein [Candidatus Bilamarchaeum dharawalense]|uniref:Uncharacterized protein n=1 Tax=Candidatus Bilamarchaeum dharawalense TaxID=2885759 RepID=A0A5E4LMM2_9ARCH|nr:Uncharacterised protein [Candidatus Bilamarchaeum dharawalense]